MRSIRRRRTKIGLQASSDGFQSTALHAVVACDSGNAPFSQVTFTQVSNFLALLYSTSQNVIPGVVPGFDERSFSPDLFPPDCGNLWPWDDHPASARLLQIEQIFYRHNGSKSLYSNR